MSRDHVEPPYQRRLTPQERARVLRKLDVLDDRLLFTWDRGRLAPFLGIVRGCAWRGTLRPEDVPRLAALFRRYGVE